jgi:hypothetical protein
MVHRDLRQRGSIIGALYSLTFKPRAIVDANPAATFSVEKLIALTIKYSRQPGFTDETGNSKYICLAGNLFLEELGFSFIVT